MIRAALDRLDGVAQRIVRGENDHLGFRMLALDLLEHFQAVRVGQLQIEENDRGRVALEKAQPGGRRRRRFRLITVTAEQRLQGEQDRPLIVNDQDSTIVRSHGASQAPATRQTG